MQDRLLLLLAKIETYDNRYSSKMATWS